MITLELAAALRDAGLAWRPRERDTFALPGRDMDDQVFVVSPVPVLIQLLNGHPVVAFQASAEWALDYVMLSDTLWLPSEAQLRDLVAGLLPPEATLRLERGAEGYTCVAGADAAAGAFHGPDAASAYGQALLKLLQAGARPLTPI